uniref:Potassium channel domain-containing protein n=1 Tax=Latimeria chalumnae TaxID=7897 RepID=H3AMR0_LATCH
LTQAVIQAYNTGISPNGNTTNLGNWRYSGAFFFAVTVVTTIGYGKLSPSTVGGQIFCIFFALLGIPLNLILLNRIGKWMLSGVQHCSSFLAQKFHKKKVAKAMTSSFSLVIGLLLFLLLPPLGFSAKEGWTYEEGFYYAFITLTTIGFGDYVVGTNPTRSYSGWYRDMVALWILFGLAWLALLFNLCTSMLENAGSACHCAQVKKKMIANKVAESEPREKGGSGDDET